MGRGSGEMGGLVRIESPEQEADAQGRLAALEERFRNGLADQAGTRELAREIVRLRSALTSYSLRHQVRRTYDEQLALAGETALEPL